MTPEMTLFLVAMHNLFWLVRNPRKVPHGQGKDNGQGEDNMQAAAADLVLAPLRMVAETETIDIGDLMAMTELSRWAVDLLSGTRGQVATIPFSLIADGDGSTPDVPSRLAPGIPSSGPHSSTEAWLEAAVAAFRPEFAACGYGLPTVTVFARRSNWRDWREFLAQRQTHGTARWNSGNPGVVEIRINPGLTHQLEVLNVLKHELVHAALFVADPDHGHGARFRAAAGVLGMQPTRSTPWTASGRAGAAVIAEGLGPYPPPRSVLMPRSFLRWVRGLFWSDPGPMTAAEPSADLLPLPEALAPSLLALRTLSPVTRIEGSADGLPVFSGWAGTWPGLRRLIAAPEAATVRQELISRLGLRLAAPGLTDDRLAAVLAMLATLERLPGMHSEHWLDFVAGLVTAILGADGGETEQDPLRWRRWTLEPDGQRSLAYWTGRLARVAEDLAARLDTHEYPRLVWRWRHIARIALVPWLDAHGYPALCLGHWLEGLLAGGDRAPRLTIGRRVCGFGLVDIVGLWQRNDEAGAADRSLDLDAAEATAVQAGLTNIRTRLAALPAMQALLREASHFNIRRKAGPEAAVDRPALADLVRYAETDTAGPTRR
jgi:hypothetical protein